MADFHKSKEDSCFTSAIPNSERLHPVGTPLFDSEMPEAGSPDIQDVQGVLSFSNKYRKEALEKACESALSSGKVTYTTIKNTIAAFAEELGKNGYNVRLNEERNKGAFIMGSEASDINTLLSRSKTLAGNWKEGDQ